MRVLDVVGSPYRRRRFDEPDVEFIDDLAPELVGLGDAPSVQVIEAGESPLCDERGCVGMLTVRSSGSHAGIWVRLSSIMVPE